MASVTLSRVEFTDMLNKAVKCTAKGIGDAPESAMIELMHRDNTFSMRTTDTRTVLVVKKKDVPGDDFDVVIPFEKFVPLVRQCTTKELTISVNDKTVDVIGNGTYKFPIQVEGGVNLTFPDVEPIADPELEVMLDLTELKSIINMSSKFIGTTFTDPRICGYYFGDSVITTDSVVACFYAKRFFDANVMLFDTTVAFLSAMNDEKIKFAKKDDHIQFRGPSFIIDGSLHDYSDDYPEKDLQSFLDKSYDYSVTVNVAEMKEVLGRVGLFAGVIVSTNTTAGVCLNFTEDCITISDSKEDSMACENLSYVSKDNFHPHSCKVSPDDFINAITFEGMENVTLYYGNDEAVKVCLDKVTRVLGYVTEVEDADVATETADAFGDLPNEELEDLDSFEESSVSNDLADADW